MELRALHPGALVTVAITAFLAGCGGGGTAPTNGNGNGSGSPPPAVSANGAYIGTYTVSGDPTTYPVIGAISSTGVGYFADENGAVYVLPSLSATGSLNGTLAGYAPPGYAFADGKTVDQFSVTGTSSGSDAATISGSFSNPSESGTFSIQLQQIPTPTVAALAGSYSGYYFGSGSATLSLTLAADGTFTGQDDLGCTISGSIASATGGLFMFSADSTGNASCAGALTGLGFSDSADLSGGKFGSGSGTYFYAGASNSTSAFAAELKRN